MTTYEQMCKDLKTLHGCYQTFHLIRDVFGKHVLQSKAERLCPKGHVDLGTGRVCHQENTTW